MSDETKERAEVIDHIARDIRALNTDLRRAHELDLEVQLNEVRVQAVKDEQPFTILSATVKKLIGTF